MLLYLQVNNHMSNKKIAKILNKYQKTSQTGKNREAFFAVFEKKMLYRTTKTENPTTTVSMVNRVLNRVGNSE
jgi:hypothetical protein